MIVGIPALIVMIFVDLFIVWGYFKTGNYGLAWVWSMYGLSLFGFIYNIKYGVV